MKFIGNFLLEDILYNLELDVSTANLRHFDRNVFPNVLLTKLTVKND